MKLYKGLKLAGMACACAMIMTASPFTADASQIGPASDIGKEVVAKIDAAAVSIYAAQNEKSAVIAQAIKGNTYDVLENGTDGWVKISAGSSEGYLKVPGNATLSEDSEQETEQQAVSARQQLVDYALQYVGGRYKYGGSDPRTGVDCSGFTRFVMQNGAGISLNRSSGGQAVQGRAVSASEIQPGDLIFYSQGGRINHVALYIGNGQVVHASTERTGIKISNWTYRTPVKIVSVLG